jgi:hypothetical protein
MRLEALAMEMPAVEGHPNRLPFEGVLTLVDIASDKAPSGARGHRVVLTKTAAEAALASLLGMGIGCRTGWDGHDAQRKCGVITAAEMVGQKLLVRGHFYARDFPEMERDIRASRPGSLGMSYELADVHVADMKADVWKLTRATFTGAAVLLRDKAAYRNTSFTLQARGDKTVRRGAVAA